MSEQSIFQWTFEQKLDRVLGGYIEAALWSTNDDSDESGGKPLDENYGPEDFTDKCRAKMREDCRKFLEAHEALIVDENCNRNLQEHFVEEWAGHDFWLTRNGCGSGFWDGSWKEPAAGVLSDTAKHFGEFYLFVDFESGQIED